MNYTTNYHLPQWDETDRIMRTDFNRMCADLEGAITGNTRAAAKAQNAADAARKVADAAYCPTQKPYTVGSYTGNGATQTIHLGFRPAYLIISGQSIGAMNNTSDVVMFNIFTGGNVLPDRITITDTGFSVKETTGDNFIPMLNYSKRTYDYIAFR